SHITEPHDSHACAVRGDFLFEYPGGVSRGGRCHIPIIQANAAGLNPVRGGCVNIGDKERCPMRLRLFAAAALLSGSLFAADPGLVSLAMPDTQVMTGINVDQVRLSPLGQVLLAQTGELFAGGLEKLIETT